MNNPLTSMAIRRALGVTNAAGACLLTTNFADPIKDTAFWQGWLERDSTNRRNHSFVVTFCEAGLEEPHECRSPHQSECCVPGLDLPGEPRQLLESVRLVPLADITADSPRQPQTLSMLATVIFCLTQPWAKVSIARQVTLHLRSGTIQFKS